MLRSRSRRPLVWEIPTLRVCTTVGAGALLGVALATGMARALESPSTTAAAQTPRTTATPTPKPTPTSVAVTSDVCRWAATFIEERRPQRAVALIESLRAGLSTPTPGASRPCQVQLNAALINVSQATRLAAVAAEDSDASAKRQSVAAALALDADNAEALKLKTELAKKLNETPPKDAPSTWQAVQQVFAGSWSDLQNLALAWLAILLAVLVAVRIALPIFPVHDRGPFRSLANNAKWAMWLGFAAVASGTFVVVLFGRNYETKNIPALVVTTLGALSLAYGWSRAMRVSISVLNPDGKSDSSAEGHVIALLSELGGAPPRGVETPRGSDATVLQSAGLTSAPDAGAIVKGLYAVAQAAVPATPWRVRVDVENEDRHCITITRNGRSVLAAVIDRDTLGLRVPLLDENGKPRSSDADTAYPDLHRMAAAAVLCALQQAYGFGGLCGATNWRSLGLHYIATTDFTANLPASQGILARAVAEDRDNRLARVAFWQAQYRESTTAPDLETYSDLLDSYVNERLRLGIAGAAPSAIECKHCAVTERDPGDQALLLRVLFARVAVGVDLWAANGNKPFPKDDAQLKTAKNRLVATNRASRTFRACSKFAVDTEQAVTILAQSVDDTDKSSSVVAVTPRECYLYACYLASLCETATEPDSSEKAKSAIEYLKRADADPTWRRWRDRDPQLKFLRDDRPEYLAEFGLSPYGDTEFLDQIAELGPFRTRLQALGFTTPQLLAGISAAELQAFVGVPEATALRIAGIAKLANFQTDDQTEDLAAWRVDIARALLRLGVTHLPAPEGTAQRVLAQLEKRKLNSKPELEQLQKLIGAAEPNTAQPKAAETKAAETID